LFYKAVIICSDFHKFSYTYFHAEIDTSFQIFIDNIGFQNIVAFIFNEERSLQAKSREMFV